MAGEKKLTRLERRFGQIVASGVNAKQALMDAGWKGRDPKTRACRMMQLPRVREYIDKLEEDALRTAGISRVQIVKELGRIAFADPRKLLDQDGGMKPLTEIDDDTAAVIAALDVEEIFSGRGEDRRHIGNVRKVKLWNKREALTELASIAGMKREQLQQTPHIGPGLTVIVQNGVQVSGQQVTTGQRVEINLPPPA